MATILNIETSTEVCSTVLSQNGECLLELIHSEGMSHAVNLQLFIQETLDFVKSNDLKLDAVAVSSGPGSYTGLRIGVSSAKGLCFGAGIPLIAVDTLKIMANGAIHHKQFNQNDILCPMIDARRMEVYSTCYNKHLKQIVPTSASIVDKSFMSNFRGTEHNFYFFGNGANKCVELLADTTTFLIDNIVPSAKDMFPLAEIAFENRQFEDVAYFEPFYLKEFMATVAKPKL